MPLQFLADQLTLSQPEGAVLTVHSVEIETASEKILNLDGIVLLELCWFPLDLETVAPELCLGFFEVLLELKILELDWRKLELAGIVLLELCWFALGMEVLALELYFSVGFLEFSLELKFSEMDWR